MTPTELSHSQTSVPSKSQARMEYPPPGHTTTAAPVAFSFGAGKTDKVGTVTSPNRITFFCPGRCGRGPSSPTSPFTSPGASPGQSLSVFHGSGPAAA